MPDEPESLGVLALMLHCEARRKARFSSTGEFIPLDQQDTTRWLGNLVEEAEKLLRTAAGFGQTGGSPPKLFCFFHQIPQPPRGVLLVARDGFAGADRHSTPL